MVNLCQGLYVLIIVLMLLVSTGQTEEVKIITTPITKQIYTITGKGGNIGLFIGKDGTFLIDDQFAPLTEKIVVAIKSVGGDFPKFLINTHYHGDHTGGNENLGQGGTLTFSHDNVRERLATGSFIAALNIKRNAVSREGLPVVTFSEDISFHLNGDSIHAIHVPHAHTDGDSFIQKPFNIKALSKNKGDFGQRLIRLSAANKSEIAAMKKSSQWPDMFVIP